MLAQTLTPEVIREFLESLSTAIERDQMHVDGLPPDGFPIGYDDDMWRTWRLDHRVFIKKLALTTDAIPPVVLWRLTGIAISYEPALVGGVLLELFAEVVSGSCAEDCATAECFFGWLIDGMAEQPKGRSRHDGAHASILTWLPTADPLGIARDPECEYG